MRNFFKKSKPTLKDALTPPETNERLGDFTGFMRVFLFKNGLLLDGKYDVDQLAHALGASMVKDPKILEVIEKAVMIHKIESNPILSVLCSLARELMTDENGNCTCQKCTAKREEEKAQNN